MDFQTELDKIMDNFDFQRVQEVMYALDWYWAALGRVPESNELRQKARELLRMAYQEGTSGGRKYVVATGGFYATYDPQDSYLSLSFKLAEWSNYDG